MWPFIIGVQMSVVVPLFFCERPWESFVRDASIKVRVYLRCLSVVSGVGTFNYMFENLLNSCIVLFGRRFLFDFTSLGWNSIWGLIMKSLVNVLNCFYGEGCFVFWFIWMVPYWRLSNLCTISFIICLLSTIVNRNWCFSSRDIVAYFSSESMPIYCCYRSRPNATLKNFSWRPSSLGTSSMVSIVVSRSAEVLGSTIVFEIYLL